MATKDEDGVWVQMCYFVEFEKDDKGFLIRKFVGDEEGNMTAIRVRKSISYDELYKKVMRELKIDSRLYELEMRCENPVPSRFPEPLMRIDCDNRVRFLMSNLDRTKLSITLKKKVVESGASICNVGVDGNGWDVCVISSESSEVHRVEKSHYIAIDDYDDDTYGHSAKRSRSGVVPLLCPLGKDVVLNACQPSFVRKKRNGRKRKTGFGQDKLLLSVGHKVAVKIDDKGEAPTASVGGSITRQRKCCLHCGTDTTPQWRVGPMGRNTLCNACGLRHKFGRLVPEYRPACSPTFSTRLHSNSHSNIIVMKKQKQQALGNACGVRHEVDARRNCRGEAPTASLGGSITGQRRSCLDCGTDTTPQWHVGPMGPNTLCNACGVKHKSDCLVPESRPTFSARLHPNSHSNIIVLKKQKQQVVGNASGVRYEVDVRGDSRGEAPNPIVGGSITGQRRCCLDCGTDTTPEWHVGPMGPNTLCNACGVKYKSDCLVPETRPAFSPKFSARLHSNSDRKIIVMRKHKQQALGNACEVDVKGDDKGEAPTASVGGSITRQRKCCLHCGTDTTPQWRDGPMGHKTLCNACGLSYKKGRLVPEYRPACSPTFSAGLHSNFHKRIKKMRKQKQQV